MRKKKLIQSEREKELHAALLKIANMGVGISQTHVDWANTGRNATAHARMVLAPKCQTCGRVWEKKP